MNKIKTNSNEIFERGNQSKTELPKEERDQRKVVAKSWKHVRKLKPRIQVGNYAPRVWRGKTEFEIKAEVIWYPERSFSPSWLKFLFAASIYLNTSQDFPTGVVPRISSYSNRLIEAGYCSYPGTSWSSV